MDIDTMPAGKRDGLSVGDSASCMLCGKGIVWLGKYWWHYTTSPRDPGVPEPTSIGKSDEMKAKDAEIERLRAVHIEVLQWVKRLNWIIGPDFDGSEDLRSTHKDVSNWLAEQRQAALGEG